MRKASRDTFRLDRLLTTRVVWPVVRRRAAQASGAIPMLMYHSISPDLDVQRAPYYRVVTAPSTFAAHLRLLKSEGFAIVTLSEAVAMLRDGSVPREGPVPVVITFDDGLEDFYTNAFPLLEAEGARATVFLSSAYIDGRFPTGHRCLSARQVRELASRGIEFGSHSATHGRLVEQTPERLEHELAASKADIEAILGKEVDLFSYPYRFPAENREFVDRLHDRLVANGYRAGVTTTVGRATPGLDMLFLPRLPVNDCDDDEFFRAKLFGAYDWFGGIQYAYKKWKSGLGRARAGAAR